MCNLYSKNNYVKNREALKQALVHGLILEKPHRPIKFNNKAWLKPYIDMKTELRTKSKNIFENDFYNLSSNSEMFGKTLENVRRHRDINPVTTDRRSHLASTSSYDTTKCYSEKPLAIETETKRNKLV